MNDPEIFDRKTRAVRRDRAAAFGSDDVLRLAIAEELVDRLAMVRRDFIDILDLGCGDGTLGRMLEGSGRRVAYVDAGACFAERVGGVKAEEDRLPFEAGSFDLIVSANVLDQVNDLPGALIQARRLLRPDGLFLAGFCAGGTLPRLREAFLRADLAEGRAVARIHPQIPLQACADLLQRAGFAMPVADGFTLQLRYGSLFRLIEDLRAMAATNLLADRQALSRRTIGAAIDAFDSQADSDGRVTERFEIAVLTGWAPAASQQKPARRGSATVSLADALSRK